MSFITDVLPDAQYASAQTGVPVPVILAQWIDETGNGTSQAWLQGHNYAGVSPGGHVAYYPDRASGLAAYVRTMNAAPYAAVRAAGSIPGAIAALGASPWAGSHYGNPPGADLSRIVAQDNLAQYDTSGGTSGGTSSTAGPAVTDVSFTSGLTGALTRLAVWVAGVGLGVALVVAGAGQAVKAKRARGQL